MFSNVESETDVVEQLSQAVKDVFVIQDVTIGTAQLGLMAAQREPRRAVRLRGALLRSAAQAYDIVSSRFRNLGFTTLFRRDGNTDVILAMPGQLPTSEARPLLAVGLFIATFLSCLFAGGVLMGGETVLADGFQARDLLNGWPFALGLLSILLAHELGHYFVARRYGAPVSLPYFIPMPFSPFGTFGAVINMKAPPANRRQLLAIAAAGPLAGFVLAVPVLIIGLMLSKVQPLPSGGYSMEGNSLLYAGIKFLIFGKLLPGGGEDVFLHQAAFAGWAGLLVTGLNLLPVGTLDGGHIVYALIGEKARYLTWPAIGLMAALSFVWNGWLLWAALLFLFGRYHAVPLNDITPLTGAGRAIAIAVIILFILTFVPVPLTIVP
jgi:membrane-associated protease RseP (regulator of RpoE activity)